jgi:hypothetical protein
LISTPARNFGSPAFAVPAMRRADERVSSDHADVSAACAIVLDIESPAVMAAQATVNM